MQKTLAEIARIVDGEVVGNKDLVITGLSGIDEAKDGDLTFVSNPKYIPLTKKTKASAILTPRDFEITGKSIVRTENPSLAFARVYSHFAKDEVRHFQGVHETALVADGARLDESVAVGPYAVIEEGVRIGRNSVIYGGCYISRETEIGEDCVFYPQVTVREGCSLGDRVTVHSGSVIGCDGFGYEQVDGEHVKIPQLGTVVIEDDVEIGANVTIDRARFNKTVIGRGTKIDNLVQIAHNVKVGKNCIIISQVGISGSVEIEDGAILAGQAGVAGHLKIGKGAIVAAQAGVTKSVKAGDTVSDYPATTHAKAKKMKASLKRLPHYVDVIRRLEERVNDLEKRLKEKS